MATEKRLIDANACPCIKCDSLGNCRPGLCSEFAEWWLCSVDAVEVVRCDECVHYEAPEEGDFLGRCRSGILAVSNGGEIYPGRNFYCLYGERRAPHENL
jgi:hypothetical protein